MVGCMSPASPVESRTWFSTHTLGPKSNRTHHAAYWATVASPGGPMLIATDLPMYLAEWEVGVRIARLFRRGAF